MNINLTFKRIKKWGFKTNNDNKVLSSINDLTFHKEFEDKRFDLDYDVDGLAYKVNEIIDKTDLDLPQCSKMGTAHKFSADSSTTKI